MSRDDSDLAAMLESTQTSGRNGGLKGRLRRALSFNVLREDGTEDDVTKSAKSSKLKSKMPTSAVPPLGASGAGESSGVDSGVEDTASTATVQTKKEEPNSLLVQLAD